MSGKKNMKHGVRTNLCSGCKEEREEGSKHRYCRKCDSAYHKRWNKLHPHTPLQKMQIKITKKLREMVVGKQLIPYPCDICGSEKVTPRAEDMADLYKVKWYCRKHRMNHNF